MNCPKCSKTMSRERVEKTTDGGMMFKCCGYVLSPPGDTTPINPMDYPAPTLVARPGVADRPVRLDTCPVCKQNYPYHGTGKHNAPCPGCRGVEGKRRAAVYRRDVLGMRPRGLKKDLNESLK